MLSGGFGFGLGGRASGGSFNPTTLALTGYWRASFTGSPWVGTASAGTSGSNDASEATDPPTVGATVNGYDAALFDPIDSPFLAPAGTLNTYIAPTVASGWSVIWLNGDSTSILLDPTNNQFRVDVGSGEARLVLDVGNAIATRAIAVGEWQLITWRYDGTTLAIGVNEPPGSVGGASSAAFSTSLDLTDVVVIGYAAPDHELLEFAITDTVITDQTFASVLTYVNSRYGLAMAPASATPTVSEVLTTRLYRWLRDYTLGTWTCVQGSGNHTSTSTQRPTVGTSASGQSYPVFDGVNDLLDGGIISALPTYSTSHHKLFGCLIKQNSIGPMWILASDSDFNNYVDGSGLLQFADCTSNSAINGTGWRVLIVQWNADTTTTTMYLDNVAQTATSSGHLGDDWKTAGAQIIGDRAGGGYPNDFEMISPFWAHDATTAFSSGDRLALYDALRVYVT